MKKQLSLLLSILGTYFLNAHKPNYPKGFEPAEKTQSIAFTQNKGQVWGYDGLPHPEVKYVLKNSGTQIFLLEKGIAYQFTRIHYPEGYQDITKKRNLAQELERQQLLQNQIHTETFRMDMTLVGADPNTIITTEGKSADYTNYYNHNVLDVHNYNKIIYHNIYPGIDWVIYSEGEKMKYDFIVQPGADPSLIKMEFKHQEELNLNSDGSFTLKNRMGSITEKAPVSFQGEKKIATQFILENNTLSFALENYDAKQALLIDPTLEWGTYYGGFDTDEGQSCATDASGNVYLAGYTYSTNDIASGGHQNTLFGASIDAFLVKFDNAGVRQWATYYGSAGSELGYSCATDVLGNVYLSGRTTSFSNISSNGHQNNPGGNGDAFLVKFNSAGVRLWATYYGGSGTDLATSSAIDGSGNIYLGGYTFSTGNISSSGHQNNPGGNGDAFLVKFNSAGVRQWATYYGGSGIEGFYDGYSCCTTDASGNVYLGGYTESSNGIAFVGHQNSYGGNGDAFLVKFNSNGIFQWGTYYGDTGDDHGYGCATDGAGNVYLTGYTESWANIASWGHQNIFGGPSDAFLVKFDAGGFRQWATYYGGSNFDYGYACTTDPAGNVYLTGRTESATDISSGGFQNNYGGSGDAFMIKFDGAGIRQWGSYFGGSGSDFGYGCAIQSTGYVYLAGSTDSQNDIANGLGHQNSLGGGIADAFLAKFSTCQLASQPSAISGNTSVCVGSSQLYSVINDPNATGYIWTLPGGWSGTSTTNIISVMPSTTGILGVSASGTCGASLERNLIVFVSPKPVISVVSSDPVYCTGMTATLSASGANSYTWTGGASGATFAVSPNGTTVYTVTGTNAASCTSIGTYTIVPNTTTSFNYTVSGMVATFSISNNACSSFLWDYGNGNGSSINSNPVVTYATPATYGVCLKCNGLPQGCVRCFNITVPGNMIGGVGIEETESKTEMHIYPNPNNGKFIIGSNSEADATIFNPLGQIILQQKVSEGKNTFDLSHQANGIYFIQVRQNIGSNTFKVIKE